MKPRALLRRRLDAAMQALRRGLQLHDAGTATPRRDSGPRIVPDDWMTEAGQARMEQAAQEKPKPAA